MDFAEQNQVTPSLVLEHWYYQSKFELLRRTLTDSGLLKSSTQLADLGCGLGVFLTLLERSGLLSSQSMVGIDPAATHCHLSLGGTVPIMTAWPDYSFDVILLMDVLEHIEDDRAALRQAYEKLKPGGHLFITVPAFSFLWSHHDEVLGHYRRYTISGLRKLVTSVPGLKILNLHYFYALILPIAMLVRFLRQKAQGNSSDLKPASAFLNFVLKKRSIAYNRRSIR